MILFKKIASIEAALGSYITKISKLMINSTSQSCGDGCLLARPNGVIKDHLSTHECLIGLRNKTILAMAYTCIRS